MAYQYRVIAEEYVDPEFGFTLFSGELVTDADFPEPDIPGRLIGMGVLEPADMDAELARLSGAPVVPDPVDEDDE